MFAFERAGIASSARLVIRTGPRKVYLPLIAKRYPPTKIRSGVHLGNRGNGVWNSPTDFLTRLKGTASGDYPRVVVVLSNQLYNVRRAPTGACNITDAQKLGNTYLYDYLTEAIRTKGTMVVIRIYPSPGNFSDWNNPGPNHNLIYQPDTATPNNGSYCNGNQFNYRAPRDVAQEMKAIYDLNIANGWPADHFFFEPANEPNKEWYADKANINPNLSPKIDNEVAWQAMDAYFSSIYDAAKSLNSNIQILTPPMAQDLWAETREFGSCNPNVLIVNGVPTGWVGGYDKMPNTYDVKNDGWSWHNYWRSGVEFWQDAYCSRPDIVSDQVFQAFPAWLQNRINTSTKPSFVTEADLFSPCFRLTNNVVNKDTQSNTAQQSIWQFIYDVRGADYIAVWVLTNAYTDPPLPNLGQNVGSCNDPSGNPEQAWHEAYRDAPYNGQYERDWFRLWWLRDEFTP